MLSGDVDFQAGKLGEVFFFCKIGCLDPDVSEECTPNPQSGSWTREELVFRFQMCVHVIGKGCFRIWPNPACITLENNSSI